MRIYIWRRQLISPPVAGSVTRHDRTYQRIRKNVLTALAAVGMSFRLGRPLPEDGRQRTETQHKTGRYGYAFRPALPFSATRSRQARTYEATAHMPGKDLQWLSVSFTDTGEAGTPSWLLSVFWRAAHLSRPGNRYESEASRACGASDSPSVTIGPHGPRPGEPLPCASEEHAGDRCSLGGRTPSR